MSHGEDTAIVFAPAMGLRQSFHAYVRETFNDSPVLSVQMVVAQPIVSAAARLRTRLLSASMRFTLYARAMVTASGRPSGMATTCTLHSACSQSALHIIVSTCNMHMRRFSQN